MSRVNYALVGLPYSSAGDLEYFSLLVRKSCNASSWGIESYLYTARPPSGRSLPYTSSKQPATLSDPSLMIIMTTQPLRVKQSAGMLALFSCLTAGFA